jgi:hypothetical protein
MCPEEPAYLKLTPKFLSRATREHQTRRVTTRTHLKKREVASTDLAPSS